MLFSWLSISVTLVVAFFNNEKRQVNIVHDIIIAKVFFTKAKLAKLFNIPVVFVVVVCTPIGVVLTVVVVVIALEVIVVVVLGAAVEEVEAVEATKKFRTELNDNRDFRKWQQFRISILFYTVSSSFLSTHLFQHQTIHK